MTDQLERLALIEVGSKIICKLSPHICISALSNKDLDDLREQTDAMRLIVRDLFIAIDVERIERTQSITGAMRMLKYKQETPN